MTYMSASLISYLLIFSFSAGVTHSFTDNAEDRDKLLSFSNMYIGEYSAVFWIAFSHFHPFVECYFACIYHVIFDP